MKYYNQHKYPHVPYPRPSDKSATVKSGGCGVCCGSTVLSFFDVDMPPEKLAPIYIAKGARADSGTNMKKAVEIICELGNLAYTTTSDEAVLAAHLRDGGIAIANVDGDAGEKGIFSADGHYICVVGIKPNGDLIIYDVGDYATKFSSPKYAWRAAYVKREGELLVCSQATLNIDTKHRTPNYYLFKRKEAPKMDNNTPSGWAKEAWELAKKVRIMDGTNPQQPLTREQFAVVLHRLGLLKEGSR